jgi:hypothetical protein
LSPKRLSTDGDQLNSCSKALLGRRPFHAARNFRFGRLAVGIVETNRSTDSDCSTHIAELTADEKNLLARGYKVETRNGQKYFCHNEAALGTRFKNKVCATAEQLAGVRQESKDAATDAQRTSWNSTHK